MNDNSTNSPEKMLLLGERLKKCRKAAGFTQPKLVEMIESLPENNGKIRSEKHISAVERGECALSIEYATLISKVLHVRSEYLLGYDDFQTREHDMIIEDTIGRKVHIKSNEMNRIYEDIEFMIKCRIEREFNDPTRYAYAEDMKGTFDNIRKELE